MAETSDNLDTLEVASNIFANIKFFVSGEIPEKVVDLLKSGGAERLNYFSDYVTHLICGENPEENDICDANDLYEIPAVTATWVVMCIKLKKLVNTKPYIYNLQKLFSTLVFCLSKSGSDRETLWGIITYHGGLVQLNLDNRCTHLVTIDINTPKYEKASSLGSEKIVIITPDWIIDSVKNSSLAQPDLYHPKRIKWPKVIKHESTTAITGFEPEKVEPVDKAGDSQVTDSTQALLDKLKQRMPWIQPQTTSTGEIVPPNVVAPSFLTKNQQNQNQIRAFSQNQSQQPPPSPATTTFVQPPQNVISNQQIPRSIVHHTPQPQQMMQQQQQQQSPQPQQQPAFNLPNQLHLNRLIGQQQNRPTLQQLRSQLGPTQLHHHLLQQRIAQQNQQNAQRPLSLQQQQLLQQQLAQGQLGPARQLLQNQQQQQLSQLNQQIMQNQQQNQQGNQQLNQMQQPQPVSMQNQQFGNIVQQQQHILQQQQQPNQVLQQQNQVLQQQQQQQNQVLQQQNQVLQQQQQQSQVLQQQQQQQSQILQQQQQNQALQQQQSVQVLPQQQQNPVLQQQQQSQVLQQQQGQVLQQQGQVLQQQNKIFVSQQQQQTPQQIVQNQPNLAIQQQFVGQNQQQFPQQQSPQQQPNQHFVQNQQDLNQQQNLLNPQVVQNPQFQQNNIINQQLLLNQQQNQFNQQQPNQAQPRPQINQHLWQQQQQQATQQPQQQQQMTIRHPVNIVQQGPRIQWSPNQQPNQPQRQYIHLDAQTHNELQKMNPEQQALFVQRLKQKQLLMQKQLAQRAGGGHILIRGSVPPGLNPQQQMQWLQRQAKQQGVVLPPNIQQQTITPGALTQQNIPAPNIQHTPGLSPIQQQPPPQFPDQNQQQQLQLRQQYRIQQLQLQREQAQKSQLAAQQQAPVPVQAPGVVRPLGPVIPDSTTNPPEAAQQLVVNAKTKTALANMLSNRLQSGGGSVGPVPEAIPEPSAAGTLRLMTAQHNAALNPNNRPQDLIALQQRRVINGPNGEIIRALVPQAVPVMPQNEPPKVPFSPRAAVPMQHRPGPYYGHNPNLKLPPDLFLLGCIFVVVEIERYLDESLPGWQQKIEKYGGEVEKQYCTRVTHVLCETQRHGVVMQALRDCKRCVTVYWLSDVIKRKQVLPPWTALHLPAIYFDSTPAAKHLITLSGFSGCDRNRVKHMITYTGAKFTSYFSKHNTILIAAKAEGAKYVHAKKWGIPVVNVQWLTDIMLGNFTALNQTEHIMYQQFPTPPNFSFDPKLIPTLMHGWKAPINISQDSYERVKRSPSPVLLPKKAKKMKTEQTDENDNVNDEGVEVNCNYRILFSMSSEVGALQKIVRQLGGVLAKSHQDCTHLVMPSLARTNKLLFCVCREVHIMPEQWLRDSHSAQKFLDEANYSLDTKDFNSEYKCDFAQTLSTKNRNRLFEGKSFWITPSVFPSKSALVELVHSCGGGVERVRRTAAQIEATNANAPYSYVIITHENDIHLVADLLKNKKDKVRIVCSAELIFSAILKQTFEVEPYAVKVL